MDDAEVLYIDKHELQFTFMVGWAYTDSLPAMTDSLPVMEFWDPSGKNSLCKTPQNLNTINIQGFFSSMFVHKLLPLAVCNSENGIHCVVFTVTSFNCAFWHITSNFSKRYKFLQTYLHYNTYKNNPWLHVIFNRLRCYQLQPIHHQPPFIWLLWIAGWGLELFFCPILWTYHEEEQVWECCDKWQILWRKERKSGKYLDG